MIGHKKIKRTDSVTEFLNLDLSIDRIDGEWLDTSVTFNGGMALNYKNIESFKKDLAAVIEKYAI